MADPDTNNPSVEPAYWALIPAPAWAGAWAPIDPSSS